MDNSRKAKETAFKVFLAFFMLFTEIDFVKLAFKKTASIELEHYPSEVLEK